LSSDQRVHKVCSSLYSNGFDVLLVGRKLKDSLAITDRAYQIKRFKLLFNKGVLFYAEYQLRLFLFLMFTKFQSLHANDLDTLLPNFLAARLKSKPLVYDSHEYYTEVPELQGNPIKKRIWESVEAFIFPRLKYVFTVNVSIANEYKNKYNKEILILRNVPSRLQIKTSNDFQLPTYLSSKPYAILQGAGINVDRGAEELVQAMQFVNELNLLIVGSGDVLPELKNSVADLKLQDKVFFIQKLPYQELLNYTRNAAFGLTLDKDTNLNYRFSLPNKIFDYAAVNIPVLASALVETKRIYDGFEIGLLISTHDPKHIALQMQKMIEDSNRRAIWIENTKRLSAKNYWEKEVEVLLHVYLHHIKKRSIEL
jgi:glycosyltransferase involved in cell wall biosynthesis